MAVTKRPTLQDIGDNPVIIEKLAGATIPAGNIVALNSSDALINHASAGVRCPVIVAVEDGIQVADETESYASGELMKAYVVQPGRKVYLNLATSQVAVIGSKLASNGAGAVRVAVAATAAVAADGVTGTEGGNNGITYTANVAGTVGNMISIALIDPSGNDASLAVSVQGSYIAVSLATGGAGAITSTAAQVIAAINGDTEASALVTASNTGASTGASAVAAATVSLSGGTDYVAGDVPVATALQAVTTTSATAKILAMAD